MGEEPNCNPVRRRATIPDGDSELAERSEAISAGPDAYDLRAEAEGASRQKAFAVALGRAVERYLDSLDHEARIRLLLGLMGRGGSIPEESQLPDDREERRRVLEAAARLAREGRTPEGAIP
ncbi:MAG: hypothetical protein LC808_00770 [Actinobacteria bacterium]|nr:hypothetical protein [Actinomycetota bacterium]